MTIIALTNDILQISTRLIYLTLFYFIILFYIIVGISQSSVDCFLPEILVRKNFIKFVVDEIDLLYPPEIYHRVVAHPPSDTIDVTPIRINQLQRNIVTKEGEGIEMRDDGHFE